MRSHAVPTAFASCTICARRVSKRDSAPENVNAIISPSSANTAVSSEPTFGIPCAPKRTIARCPSRRPSTRQTMMPTNSPSVIVPPKTTGLMTSSADWSNVPSLGRRVYRLLNDLVGAREQGLRKLDPECLGRLEIENQLEPVRLHDRQIAGLRALQDPAGVDARLEPGRIDARSVAHQPARRDGLRAEMDDRNAMARGEVDHPLGVLKIEA